MSRSRRRRKQRGPGSTDDIEVGQEWRVSMVGAFVFVHDTFDNRKTKGPDFAARSQWAARNEKARNLLTSRLAWPLPGIHCISIVCARVNMEMLFEDLVAAPPSPGAMKRR